MKRNRKSWRTTYIGVLTIIVLMAALTLVYFGKATLTEVGTFLGFFVTAAAGFLALVAKDSKVQSLTDAEVKSVETIIKKEEKE